MLPRGLLALVASLVLASCAPTVDGPAEQQRTTDVGDGERIARQIRALPGVVSAEVLLSRPVGDPLTTQPARPPALGIVAIVDDHADREAIRAHIAELSRVVSAEVDPRIVVEVGATRPELATIGPFTVTTRSRNALRALIAIALAAVAGLAIVLAARNRARPAA